MKATKQLGLADFAAEFLQVENSAGQLVPARPGCTFHRDLVIALEDSVGNRPTKQVWLAPRGFAKSVWTSFVFPMWAALQAHEKYILIVSETDRQAGKILRNIKREIERNARLRDTYQACRKGSLWRGNEIELPNGVLIHSIGVGGNVLGSRQGASRPSLIVVDDPQRRDDAYSALRRERSLHWLNADLLPIGSPRSNFFVLGTAIHREALAMHLYKQTGWDPRLFKALPQMPVRSDLWMQWQTLLHERRADEGEQAAKQAAVRARAFYDLHTEAMNQ